jgi:hypothetical protein
MSAKKKPHNYLDMVPVRNVQEYTEEEGKITLLIPKFKSEWMRKWLISRNRSKHIHARLDTLGSKVWRNIDGVNDVSTICQNVSEQIKSENKTEEQLDERIATFLTQLYKHRLIIFREI